MKSESGEEKPRTRVMTVFYERLTDDEEIALCNAVEDLICKGNVMVEDHDCRLHMITWKDLVEEED